MARNHAPITSFGAELHAVLREGADREVRLKFDNPRAAVRMKQRLHSLRDAMKKSNHKDWPQLYRCGVYEDPNDKCVLVIGPKDSEFRAAIKAAGIQVADPPPSTTVEITTSPGNVSDFLAELTEATSVQNALDDNTDEDPPVDEVPLDKL